MRQSPVADPDLELRGGGGEEEAGDRFWFTYPGGFSPFRHFFFSTQTPAAPPLDPSLQPKWSILQLVDSCEASPFSPNPLPLILP